MTLFPKLQEKLLETLSPFFVAQKSHRPLNLMGIEEDARSLLPFLSHDLLSDKTLWIIAENIEKSHNRMSSLLAFQSFFGSNLSICFLPEEEVLPYEPESPPDFIRAERIHALNLLAQGKVDVVVTTWPAVVRKTLPPRLLSEVTWTLSAGEFIERTALADSLVRLGFLRVLQVSAPGEFAVRGAILDLYSPAHQDPVRLEWDDDILASIRSFDINNQKSLAKLSRVEILPGSEWIPPTGNVKNGALSDWLKDNPVTSLVPGVERFIPSIYEDAQSPLDYGRKPVLLIEEPSIYRQKKKEWEERIREGWEALTDSDKVLLPSPEKAFLFEEAESPQLIEKLYPTIYLSDFSDQEDLPFSSPVESLLQIEDSWAEGLSHLIGQTKVLSVFRTRGQRDRFQELLTNQGIPFFPASGLQDIEEREPLNRSSVWTILGDVEKGFYIPSDNILVLSENFLFRKRPEPRIHRAFATATSIYRKDRPPLNEGEPVVHLQHGIGLYRGLKEIMVGSIPGEFFVVEYRDLEKLYVPVDHADLLQPYRGPEGSTPTLDRIGGQTWNRTRQKVRKEIEKISQDLVDLYARRKTVSGHSFSSDLLLVREFENSFPYDLTPDQEDAWRAVCEDMEAPTPMDRLILGDVGFGKTEIAMRAAFKAVADGYQVALLVPTTLLAKQHYESFLDRFSGFPVRICHISRMVSQAEIRATRKKLSLGEIDILIGTTALISKETSFRNLGLLIIDEEQRFGVGQKEKLKSRYTSVDVLTLSATPIPRTLQMSLSGLRGISFIMTPPPGRKPIRTAILTFDRHRIHEAIDRELARDGQVFFIHNRVQTISRMVHYLAKLFPEVPIGMAHGQMEDSRMEEVMEKFIQRHYRILVSTAIVESGLDIPAANTIIVNRADMFGISELYQIRGRVGRSGQQAYAYFLIPSESGLTDTARKRLKTLQDNTSLGSGYQIAMRDMEIRGAGSLLGHQQTGHIALVGLDLYLEMVEEAIQSRIEPEAVPLAREEVRIDLGRESRFPEDYIEHPAQRIDFYRRLSLAKNMGEIDHIESEVSDRFGPLPRSSKGLFLAARLKFLSLKHGFSEVRVRDRELVVKPSFFGVFTPEKIQILTNKFEGRLWINPDSTFCLLGSPSTFVNELDLVGHVLSGKSDFQDICSTHP